MKIEKIEIVKISLQFRFYEFLVALHVRRVENYCSD